MPDALPISLGLSLAVYVLLAPAVALGIALTMRRRIAQLEARLEETDALTTAMAFEARAARQREPAAHQRVEATTQRREQAAAERVPPAPAVVDFARTAPVPVFVPTASRMPAPVVVVPAPSLSATAAAPPPHAAPIAGPSSVDEEPPAEEARDEAVAPPSLVGRPSLEEKLGLTWLTRTGVAVFVLGALFFFKYAVDSAWIGPAARVGLGATLGVGMVVSAELLRARTRPSFVRALVGLGLAVVFVSIWASAALYGLVTMSVAFLATTAILMAGAALSNRHQSEAALALSLAAGLLNPLVLSTGLDRPAELFGYLLLVTSVTHVVSARQGFRLVPWAAVAGVVALFAHWHMQHFDPAGSYATLGSRLVPLAFVALFAAQWIGLSFWRREARRSEGTAPTEPALMVLVALVLAHLGAAALLCDVVGALPFALLLVPLALVSIRILDALSVGKWLVLPLATGFITAVVVYTHTEASLRIPLVGLAALWAGIYAARFLRSGPTGEPRDSTALATTPKARPRHTATLAAVALGAFSALSVTLLFASHPTVLVHVLAFASAVAVVLARRADAPEIGIVAAIASSLAVGAAAATRMDGGEAGVDGSLVAGVLLWAMVYLVDLARAVRRSSAAPSWVSIATAVVALAGFVVAELFAVTNASAPLRALVPGFASGVGLALAALLFAHREKDALQVMVVSGLSFALLAFASEIALVGPAVTIVRAVLGLAAAAMTSRHREPLWLGVAGPLFLASLVRLVAVDARATAGATMLFLATGGREGTLVAPLFTSDRTLSLAGVGAALLASAYLLSDRRRPLREGPSLGGPSALAATSGYVLWLALAVTEVRGAFTSLPSLPIGPGGAADWASLTLQWEAVQRAQQGSLAMLTTLVLGLAAALLLTAGFAARSALHRYLGLALFCVTVAKLAAHDVWHIERVYQIVLLTGVGALLIAGGFLYARFGQRIVALMREGGPA